MTKDYPDYQKKVYAHMLSGNNALDLMDYFWDKLSMREKLTLQDESKRAEKESEVDYLEMFDTYSTVHRSALW